MRLTVNDVDTTDPVKLAEALRRECGNCLAAPEASRTCKRFAAALLAMVSSIDWYLTTKHLNEDGIAIRDGDVIPAIRRTARIYLEHGGELEV